MSNILGVRSTKKRVLLTTTDLRRAVVQALAALYPQQCVSGPPTMACHAVPCCAVPCRRAEEGRKERKSRKRNLALLSFGEQAEEEEQDLAAAGTAAKIR